MNNEDIIVKIYEFLYINDMVNFMITNKKNYSKRNIEYIECFQHYKQLEKTFSQIFLKKLNIHYGEDKIINPYNYTNLYNAKNKDTKKIGFTHYIDFIKYSDFENTNIIYGYDKFSRFYISVKYKNDNINDENNDENNEYITTFFQRYTDDLFFYVCCQNTFLSFVGTENFLNDKTENDQFIILFELLLYGKSNLIYINYD